MQRLLVIIAAAGLLIGCDEVAQPKSSSGVTKQTVQVQVDPNTGRTVEQENVRNRLLNDNKPGALKHLYVISPMSGGIILYSPIKGKVTSSGKRLTPTSVTTYNDSRNFYSPQKLVIGDKWFATNEVLQDDGTYGSSSEYLYFWTPNGVYRQIYVGNSIVIISDQPLATAKPSITIE